MSGARVIACLLSGAILTTLSGRAVRTQQTAAPSGADWPMYRRDYSGTGYSPLTQINTKNVSSLIEAWTHHTANRAEFTGDADRRERRDVSALGRRRGRARTGDRQRALATRHLRRRAVATRRRVSGPARPVVRASSSPPDDVSSRSTRRPANRFVASATDGEVDMVVPYNSVPLLYKHVVVVGANNPPGGVRVPGNARAFDARTGAKLWEFSSVAQPGKRRTRHLGGRQLERPRRGERVAVLFHAGRTARAPLFCRWHRRSPAATVAIGRAPTCTAIPWSPSTF